jgi:hypothetical protein
MAVFVFQARSAASFISPIEALKRNEEKRKNGSQGKF